VQLCEYLSLVHDSVCLKDNGLQKHTPVRGVVHTIIKCLILVLRLVSQSVRKQLNVNACLVTQVQDLRNRTNRLPDDYLVVFTGECALYVFFAAWLSFH